MEGGRFSPLAASCRLRDNEGAMGRRRRTFNKGAWELQRERFCIGRETPPADFPATGIQDVLPGVVRKWGLAAPFWLESLRREWAQIVGPDVARQARPGRLENKTLTIFVSHPTWLLELKRMERQVLEQIKKCCGGEQIRAIRLTLDPGDR